MVLFGLASKFRKVREAKVRTFYSLRLAYYTYFLWFSAAHKNGRVAHLVLGTEDNLT